MDPVTVILSFHSIHRLYKLGQLPPELAGQVCTKMHKHLEFLEGEFYMTHLTHFEANLAEASDVRDLSGVVLGFDPSVIAEPRLHGNHRAYVAG